MSEITLTYYGKVEPSGLKIRNRKIFDDELQQFLGREVEIIIRRKRKIRTNAQNRYLHLLIMIFSDKLLESTGTKIPALELKEALKAKFAIQDVFNEDTGAFVMQVVQSTSKMSMSELAGFIDAIMNYAAEFGIILPQANEQFEISYE